MDVFRLLTRSTNLQKSALGAKRIPQQQVPSSGDASHGQSFTANQEVPVSKSQSEPRGTKRKRSAPEDNPVTGSPDHLNYFEKNTENSASVPNPIEGGISASAEEIQRGHINGATLRESQRLEEDGCRRILKRNKLKVTLIQVDTQQGSKKATDAGKAKQRNERKDVRVQLTPQPLTSFKLLRTKYGISRRLANNLAAQGYTRPTEVQLGSLPLLLGSDDDRGLVTPNSKKTKKPSPSHVDLLTVAPTGSGKTLAFMLHLLHGLIEDRRRTKNSSAKKVGHEVQALIIAPTHELADQIVNEGRKLAIGTGIKVSAMKKHLRLHLALQHPEDDIHSGSAHENSEAEEAERDTSPRSVVKSNILVSTPMILLNALAVERESYPRPLPTVRYLVLDEADVLLDPLFRSQTLGIWHACNNPDLQISLWSATIGSSIESLAQKEILERRRNLDLSSSSHFLVRVVVGLKDSAVPNISHRLTYAATEQGKLLALRQLLHPSAPSEDKGPTLQPPFLIFTQTIQRAIALHSELLYDIPPEAGGSSRIAVLHSDLSDNARSAIMAGFRKGEIWVLITTDLLSRGMDFRGMNGVVNYDIPNTGASYVHRVGRTGRQGREGGVAVTLYTKEDIPYVKNIANVIAASEKAKGLPKGSEEGDVQKWLLDALPSVSKKMKKELKRKGVESRRTFEGKEGGKEARRARISTKSGYERRLENRRKGASTATSKLLDHESSNVKEASDDEWGGLDD